MPKVVVCDLDNTLVTRHENISSYTKETITSLHKQGTLFAIASGRPYCQIKPLIDTWQIHVDFVIGGNGCELVDINNATTDTFFLLKPEWVKEIIEYMKPFKANAMMVIDGKQTVQYVDDEVIGSSKYLGVLPRQIDDISEFYIENAKIMFRLEPSQMKECEQYVAKLDSPYYKGFKTQAYLMEFANKNVSKAYALNEYLLRNDLNKDDVWAFGDTSNDIDLLTFAGRGICMLNGTDDVKKIADDVTDKTCADDGFADYINKKLFGEKND